MSHLVRQLFSAGLGTYPYGRTRKVTEFWDQMEPSQICQGGNKIGKEHSFVAIKLSVDLTQMPSARKTYSTISKRQVY